MAAYMKPCPVCEFPVGRDSLLNAFGLHTARGKMCDGTGMPWEEA